MKKIFFYIATIIFISSCGTKKSVNTTYNNDGSSEKTISSKNLFGKKDIMKLKT